MTDYSKITALYSRLSVGDEDRDGGESNSIQNQKIFLENYAKGQHLTNIRHYIDDDESGRFFDRSAYSRMMDDVENGKIGVCIMKDLTRWGRDYSLELEDAVHKDVGDIACVVYMMLSNTNAYFCVKIKNQHLKQWKMTKEAVMEEALKNTCQMAPPLICTNDENKWGGSFMENGAFCLSKSDKVMGVRLSTNTKEYGAISVFYPGVLQRLAQLMGSDLYILFTSGNESTIYSANESNLEDIKTELNEMVIEYRNAMVFKCRNGMVFEEKLLSEELYYYSRIEDKISVYMEKVKVNFTTVNLKEVH